MIEFVRSLSTGVQYALVLIIVAIITSIGWIIVASINARSNERIAADRNAESAAESQWKADLDRFNGIPKRIGDKEPRLIDYRKRVFRIQSCRLFQWWKRNKK